ncbi:MAG: DUF935 family protein, partial [Syntrophorhabdus aromaticivorans]|nr:DUF935 family protein [Syntrophorhabdus aromaticivorans]
VFNYGPDKGVPKFKFHFEGDDDLEKTARVYGILVQDVNFQGIPEEHIYERFGIPKPEAGGKTVRAAASGGETNPPLKQEANKEDLSSSGIDRLVMAQGYIDTVADSALSAGAIDLSALERIVEAAVSFEDLEERLAEAYEGIGIEQFRTILAQALVRADLTGRALE